MGKDVVWRLLKRNISPAQIIGYAVANFVGMAIVLTAMQLYCDINSGSTDSDDYLSKDYLIVSKKVSGLGSLLGGGASFSEEEIDELSRQDWVERAGRFTASAYKVYGSVELGGRGISSYLFFESVPDDFFDVKPQDWKFDASDRIIPIVISKDYLSLYNFGFAGARGLPQVSEAMVGLVPLRITVSGNGMREVFDARIVGFSSRLNTIAVPEDFMAWANERFAEEPVPAPSRLILEVDNLGNPSIAKYLEEHEYESAGDKLGGGRLSYFLMLITAVVFAIGLAICVLSFVILLLSIYLLLQKNREKLRDLLLLGYSPMQVARYYWALVAVVNAAVLIASALAVALIRGYWQEPLAASGVELSSGWTVLLAGVAISLAATIVNACIINIKVKNVLHKC